MRLIKNDNIDKMLSGGAIPPFASYINVPLPMTPSMPQEAETQLNLPTNLLSKEQMKLLMEHGLPSDVENFFQTIGLLNNSIFTGPYTGLSLNSLMNMIGAYLNKISWNDNEFKRVTKTAESNGGMQELAVTSQGRLVAYNKDGELKYITPNEYKDSEGQYQLLRNSDLAQLRATNPGMAWDSSIFNIIENGIGMTKINDLLWDTISKIGKSTVQSDKYTTREGRIANGISDLLEQAPNGVYKLTSEEVSLNSLAMLALQYLYSTLPNNAKTLLKAKAIEAGLDADNGALLLITNLVQSGISSELVLSTDFDKSATDAIYPTESGGGTEKVDKMSLVENFLNGNSTDLRPYNLNTGIGHMISVPARNFNNIPSLDGKSVIEEDLLVNALQTTALAQGDTSSISMGGRVLTQKLLNSIFINGKNTAQVYLPTKRDNKGRILPNLDILENLDKAALTVKAEGGANQLPDARIKQIYEDYDIPEYWKIAKNKTNELINDGSLYPFYLVTGYILENNVEDDMIGLDEVDSDDREGIISKEALIRAQLAKSEALSDVYRNNEIGFYKDRGFTDPLFSGTLFIPLHKDRMNITALTSSVNQPKSDTMIDFRLNLIMANLNRNFSGLNTKFSSL